MKSTFISICMCLFTIMLLSNLAATAQWMVEEKALFSWDYESSNVEYRLYLATPDKVNPALIHTTTEKSYTYIPSSEGTWVFGVQPVNIETGSEAPICWSDSETCTLDSNTFQLKVQVHPQQGNRWRIIWK